MRNRGALALRYSCRKRLAFSNSSRNSGVRRFSRIWARRCSRASSAAAMASVLVWAMSRHIEKGLAPRRVISRRARPPTSFSSGASPTSSSSSALSAVAANCGRWLTHATSSSWRCGSRSMRSRTHRNNPLAPVPRKRRGLLRPLPRRNIREEPHRAAKKIRIAQFCAAALFPRHRMTRQKSRALRRIEQRSAASVICAWCCRHP